MPAKAKEGLVNAIARRACTIVRSTPRDNDVVVLHALDTFGAMLAGLQTSEGQATRTALAGLYQTPGDELHNANPAYLAGVLSACARLTETDDIHLASCTTPGSVVFASAIAAHAIVRRARTVDKPAALEAAIGAGYDVMVGLGTAIDGPTVVYTKTWPTYFAAAMTSAITAGVLMSFDEGALCHAVAIAASMTTGMAGRILFDPSSRWLTLACAVQNGIAAALAARTGIVGDVNILEHYRDAFGLTRPPWPENATDVSALAQTSLKPYCTGRQSLAAVEAFNEVIRLHAIDVRAIRRIEVRVPGQVSAMIDRSVRPQSKLESRGIHYQLALAAFHPAELNDIERSHLRNAEPDMCSLMDTVKVVSDSELTSLYPSIWAGAVTVSTDKHDVSYEVKHPKGSIEHPMTRADVATKLRTMSQFLQRPLPVADLEAIACALDLDQFLALFQAYGNGG